MSNLVINIFRTAILKGATLEDLKKSPWATRHYIDPEIEEYYQKALDLIAYQKDYEENRLNLKPISIRLSPKIHEILKQTGLERSEAIRQAILHTYGDDKQKENISHT